MHSVQYISYMSPYACLSNDTFYGSIPIDVKKNIYNMRHIIDHFLFRNGFFSDSVKHLPRKNNNRLIYYVFLFVCAFLSCVVGSHSGLNGNKKHQVSNCNQSIVRQSSVRL